MVRSEMQTVDRIGSQNTASRRKRFLAVAILGAGLAPLATFSRPVAPATTSALACATARSILGASDLTYLGAIRMPASGVDTSFAYGGMTGRIVNGHVRLFVFGNHTGQPQDAVYELEEPGSGYNVDYTQAPRATLVTDWGNVYQNARTSWDPSGNRINLPYSVPAGIYWNDSTQLLYWTYFDTYNVTQRPDWSLGATALLDPSTGASTAYGPWRPTARDADGYTHYGPWRCLYLLSNPVDGSMMCGSSIMSGNSGSPWGPDLYGGRPWPTATTPAGFGTPDLALPNRYLEYYFMGNSQSGNYVDQNGVVHGHLRSFRRTTEQALWETLSAGTVPLRANPALNGGVGSWTEMDSTSAGLWLELTNKRGVIYAGTLVGSAVQDSSDCVNAAHEWYSNAGTNPPVGACSHGCAPPVQVTGPVTTAAFPYLTIFDPDQLNAVRNGSTADYSVDPRSTIDLQQTYHIKVASVLTIGGGKNVSGLYFDPVRKYLFVLARAADDSRAGNQYLESLIHVFAIQD